MLLETLVFLVVTVLKRENSTVSLHSFTLLHYKDNLGHSQVEDSILLRMNLPFDISKTSNVTNSSTHRIVEHTIKDIFDIQQNALDHIRHQAEEEKSKYVLRCDHDALVDLLEHEKLDHAKTKLILEEEREKLEFIRNQNEILTCQLQRSKEEYENTIKTLQNKSSRETKRCDFLIARCSEVECELEKRDDLIQLKETEITELKKRIKTQKENHKHALQEMDIAKMQEDYLVKTLSESQKKKVAV